MASALPWNIDSTKLVTTLFSRWDFAFIRLETNSSYVFDQNFHETDQNSALLWHLWSAEAALDRAQLVYVLTWNLHQSSQYLDHTTAHTVGWGGQDFAGWGTVCEVGKRREFLLGAQIGRWEVTDFGGWKTRLMGQCGSLRWTTHCQTHYCGATAEILRLYTDSLLVLK